MKAPAPAGRAVPHSLAEGFVYCARIVGRVLAGASLNSAFAACLPDDARARGAAQDLSYKTLRAYGRVDGLAERLVERPLEKNELYALLLAALAELDAKVTAPHTVVNQAVEAAPLLGFPAARGLVNAVLRNRIRREAELEKALNASERARHQHPQWWIERVRRAYGQHWKSVLEHGNTHPPMTLRVNVRHTTAGAYQARLADAGIASRLVGDSALLLERPMSVDALPGFSSGEASVQDAGAQKAALLLDVRDGMRVLDACAAPGGKAGHVLEVAHCALTAVDISPERVRRVDQNLSRLGFTARVITADALNLEAALNGEQFERILLDAPCSGSGVVRRHPDIKWLRRESDLARFAEVQGRMLEALWRLLARDGKLLYATCSVFPEENEGPVRAFLARHSDARRVPLSGLDDGQILPSATSDGFYYALLVKSS
jgi:16S rRNA (cytosine967-C5)-methyltransferase